MMWIFFIVWEQYWKCDWTMNIGANRNAHGKRTISTKQPNSRRSLQNRHKWKTWQLGFQTLERYSASFQVTRLFFSTMPITRIKSFYFYFYFLFFFFLGGWVLSSNAVTIWCCIPISRPPRVIRRFKRRSCTNWYLEHSLWNWPLSARKPCWR